MRMRKMRRTLFERYLESPGGVKAAVPAVAKHIIARGNGYIVKVGEDWYEIGVTACEPPDSEEPLQDAVL